MSSWLQQQTLVLVWAGCWARPLLDPHRGPNPITQSIRRRRRRPISPPPISTTWPQPWPRRSPPGFLRPPLAGHVLKPPPRALPSQSQLPAVSWRRRAARGWVRASSWFPRSPTSPEVAPFPLSLIFFSVVIFGPVASSTSFVLAKSASLSNLMIKPNIGLVASSSECVAASS